jgi:hypothetical protein
MMKLVNIVDLKSTALELPGSNPGGGTIFFVNYLYKKKIKFRVLSRVPI